MTNLLTRREFLRSSAATVVGSALAPAIAAASPPLPSPQAQIGVLVDLTRCIGCRACMRACNDRNGLPKTKPSTTVWDGPAVALRYDQWTVVNTAGEGAGRPVPVKRQCMHCLGPACVSVCPVAALHQMDNGAVIYRAERCVGCRYCVLACPFSVPKFQWDSGMAPVIGKCQFCAQHAEGAHPACAAACPTGALKFGKREELLAEARLRIHARPERYVNHVYGEREAGGTAWLYLSDRPFDTLKFPMGLPEQPLSSYTRLAMHALPGVVMVLAVVLSMVSSMLKPKAAGGQEAPHA